MGLVSLKLWSISTVLIIAVIGGCTTVPYDNSSIQPSGEFQDFSNLLDIKTDKYQQDYNTDFCQAE